MADYFLIKGVYNPSLMLGNSKNATVISEKRQHDSDQMKDILISIDCDFTYNVMTREK